MKCNQMKHKLLIIDTAEEFFEAENPGVTAFVYIATVYILVRVPASLT